MTRLLAACCLLALGCTKQPTAPTPEEAAPVEQAVRGFYDAYLAASTGDQARMVLEGQGTTAFVDGLKQKARACREAAADGGSPSSCDNDPVLCSAGKAALSSVVVTAGGGSPLATAVLTPEGAAAINVKVSLHKDAGGLKIDAVQCP